MHLFKNVYRRKAKRIDGFVDCVGLFSLDDTVHAFDVTGVFDAAKIVVQEMKELAADKTTNDFEVRTNLPAKHVWLQLESDQAILLSRGSSENKYIYSVVSNKGAFPLDVSMLPSGYQTMIHAYIWLINTPNLVKRTLVTAKKNRSKTAPSSAWMSGDYEKVQICIDGKTINLNVSGERVGNMPLHFVRGHIRRILNGYTWVTEHYRGNPDIGQRNKQYECVTAG